MRSKELYKRIHKRTGIPLIDVELVLRAMRQELKEVAPKQESVYLKGFGTFHFKVVLGAVSNLTFSKGKKLPDRLKGTFKMSEDFIREINEKTDTHKAIREAKMAIDTNPETISKGDKAPGEI